MQSSVIIRPGREVPGDALEVRTSRASGPGGQHVNKTESRVTLELQLDRLDWPTADLDRVKRKLASRLTTDGRLQVHADAHRRQNRNLEDARRRLALILNDALHVPKVRRATKPSFSAQRRRVEAKRRQGEKKRNRGKTW